MTPSSKKLKKTTTEVLAELRATGYTPFVDEIKGVKIVEVSEGITVREIGEPNTMRLAQYLLRQ